MRYITWFPVENQLPEISSSPGYNTKGRPYSGSPRKHPYDDTRILLLTGMLENDIQACYDFSMEDILHIDEVENMVSSDGESIQLVKLWVKNGARAFSLTPFEVGN